MFYIPETLTLRLSQITQTPTSTQDVSCLSQHLSKLHPSISILVTRTIVKTIRAHLLWPMTTLDMNFLRETDMS